jgi:hypothetical protein
MDDALQLPAIACRIPLSEIYARVDFFTAEPTISGPQPPVTGRPG